MHDAYWFLFLSVFPETYSSNTLVSSDENEFQYNVKVMDIGMFYVVYTIPHPVYGMFTTSFSFIHIYLEGLRNDKW